MKNLILKVSIMFLLGVLSVCSYADNTQLTGHQPSICPIGSGYYFEAYQASENSLSYNVYNNSGPTSSASNLDSGGNLSTSSLGVDDGTYRCIAIYSKLKSGHSNTYDIWGQLLYADTKMKPPVSPYQDGETPAKLLDGVYLIKGTSVALNGKQLNSKGKGNFAIVFDSNKYESENSIINKNELKKYKSNTYIYFMAYTFGADVESGNISPSMGAPKQLAFGTEPCICGLRDGSNEYLVVYNNGDDNLSTELVNGDGSQIEGASESGFAPGAQPSLCQVDPVHKIFLLAYIYNGTLHYMTIRIVTIKDPKTGTVTTIINKGNAYNTNIEASNPSVYNLGGGKCRVAYESSGKLLNTVLTNVIPDPAKIALEIVNNTSQWIKYQLNPGAIYTIKPKNSEGYNFITCSEVPVWYQNKNTTAQIGQGKNCNLFWVYPESPKPGSQYINHGFINIKARKAAGDWWVDNNTNMDSSPSTLPLELDMGPSSEETGLIANATLYIGGTSTKL